LYSWGWVYLLVIIFSCKFELTLSFVLLSLCGFYLASSSSSSSSLPVCISHYHYTNKQTFKLSNELALFRQRRPSFTSIWDKEDWAIHTSRKRYLRYILEFPTSRLLRRCLPQMAVLLLWSLIAMWIGSREVSVAKLHIGLTPMSLISTFVAALLTLRSNQGLSRLTEARNAFGQVVLLTREMAQLISTNVYPVDPQMGLLAGKKIESSRETVIVSVGVLGRKRGNLNNDLQNQLSSLSLSYMFVPLFCFLFVWCVISKLSLLRLQQQQQLDM
jgi:hypothetical protein